MEMWKQLSEGSLCSWEPHLVGPGCRGGWGRMMAKSLSRCWDLCNRRGSDWI